MDERETLGQNVILQFSPLAPAQPVNIVRGKVHLVGILAVVLRERHLIELLPLVLIAAVQDEVIFPPRPLAGLAVPKDVCRIYLSFVLVCFRPALSFITKCMN